MGDVVSIHQPEPARLRAVIYLRVSTAEQAATDYGDDGYSIQAQAEACKRAADRLGADVVDEYVDRGKSARSADRPQLQAMLRRLSNQQDIDFVIVHKIDRLARNRADDIQIVLAIRKAQAQLISATENIDETPSGTLLHAIMAAVAEFYSGNLAQEAKKGMQKKAELGGTPGVAPIGYLNTRDRVDGKDIGIVILDPERADHVRWAFETFAEGNLSIAGLREELIARGLTQRATVRYPDRPVGLSQVHNMLRNRYYVGLVTFAGVEHPGRHEALVDEVTFRAVQDVLSSRSRVKDKPQKHPHPLKAVLHCARCGARMGVILATGRNGQQYPYFYCLGRQRDATNCKQGHVRMERVEAAVLRHLDGFRRDAAEAARLKAVVIESFTSHREASQREVRLQEGRIDKLNRRRTKLKEAYFGDAMDIAEFKIEQQAIARDLLAAEVVIQRHAAALGDLERGVDDAVSLLRNPALFYQAAPPKLQRMLVQELFEKVWILGDRVVGSDLSRPFRELLGAEAGATATAAASGDDRGSITYGRMETSPRPVDLRVYLRVERPNGLLDVDDRRWPRDGQAAVSNLFTLVGLTVSSVRTSATDLSRHPRHDVSRHRRQVVDC
jgi:site-specific DNA recombinase